MQVQKFDGDRELLRFLFELAEDSEQQIDAYLRLGEVLIATDGDEIIGHLQLIETAEATVLELRNMAVVEYRRHQGIGRALVEAAKDACRARNACRMLVSTASADTGNIRFYQRVGFRVHHIVRDAFSPATGYLAAIVIDGILLRDKIVLDLDIANPA
jgi:predicted N-acetyltransferase YhbS